ncbi:hypothetical protein EW146_g7834 [Bondarzewia mesenterica]|uniref:Uncharacterized protein n=1 Tax=Bondarzewia mesenterica TaxID=1095465 RepID=A0A4S4LJ22_9AGAM|nr:hypothetical protein EW146_g7834 [Bondarzewia mesenterica]
MVVETVSNTQAVYTQAARAQESARLNHRQEPISHWNINFRKRQNGSFLVGPPAPTATTSINWWPYPPWGSTTTALAVLPEATVPSAAIITSAAPSPLATPTTIISSTSVPSTSSAPSTTSDPASTTSASLTRITSLPPAASIPKLRETQPFNFLYLLPVFIVGGLLLGAACGFVSFKLCRRRQRARDGSLEYGHPYISPACNTLNNTEEEEEEPLQEVALHAVGSPSKYTRHGTVYSGMPMTGGAVSTQPSRSFSRVSGRRVTEQALTLPPISRSSTLNSSADHGGRGTRLNSRVRSPDPLALLSEEEEDAPYETLRHTSIRRGILERLKFGSQYRGGERGRKTASDELEVASRPYSPRDSEDVTQWAPGRGFMIVEEDPEASGEENKVRSVWQTKDEVRQAVDRNVGERWLAWTRSWSPSSSYPPTEDRYTPMPSRQSSFDRRSPRPPMKHIDSSVLPLSPKLIKSDPLDSTLFFSPSQSQLFDNSRKPSTAAKSPGEQTQTKNLSRNRHSSRPVARSRHSREHSSAASVQRSTTARSDASATSVGTRTKRAALDKVEAIVAKSLSSRDVNGARMLPGSPTRSGAANATVSSNTAEHGEADEDLVWAAGIEQRLASIEGGKR